MKKKLKKKIIKKLYAIPWQGYRYSQLYYIREKEIVFIYTYYLYT